jgi:multiple sugar transport system substrate-binding protein
MKKNILLVILLLLMSMAMIACSGQDSGSNNNTVPDPVQEPQQERQEANEEQTKQPEPAEPVTLIVVNQLFNEETFDKVSQLVKEEFPHITLEGIQTADGLATIPEMIARGESLDMFLGPVSHYGQYLQMEIVADITEEVEKLNVDLSKLNPEIMTYLHQLEEGKLGGAFPIYGNIQVLFYNKEIFDAFGLEYPQDGMTYEEVIALHTRLTRTNSEGEKFFGFVPPTILSTIWQLEGQMLDPETDMPLFDNSNQILQAMLLHQSVFMTPGMELLNTGQARDAFWKEQNLAMLSDWVANSISMVNEVQFDWDFVNIPVFAGKNAHSSVDFHASYANTMTKHLKDVVAVQVFLATSPKVQTFMAHNGTLPLLSELASEYGAGLLDDKNLSVMAKTVMAAKPEKHSVFEGKAALWWGPLMNEAYSPIMRGEKDINTGLRDAQEAANARILADKASNN